MDLLKLNPFPSVAANAVATMSTRELAGRSVHGLAFKLGGTTFNKSHISNVRVGLDGKDIINGITGAQLQDLNDYAGLADTTNYLFVWFGDPTARTVRGQHMGDLDLSVYDRALEIEVTIGAATAPTLSVQAMCGVPKLAMGIGFDQAEAATLRALTRTIISPTGAVSRQSFGVNIGSQAGARLRRVGMFHTNLTSVELRKAGFIKHDDLAIDDVTAWAADYARTAQSGLYMIDRIVDGNQGEAEETVQANGAPWPFQLNVTTSGADTITVFSDVHAALPLL